MQNIKSYICLIRDLKKDGPANSNRYKSKNDYFDEFEEVSFPLMLTLRVVVILKNCIVVQSPKKL